MSALIKDGGHTPQEETPAYVKDQSRVSKHDKERWKQ